MFHEVFGSWSLHLVLSKKNGYMIMLENRFDVFIHKKIKMMVCLIEKKNMKEMKI